MTPLHFFFSFLRTLLCSFELRLGDLEDVGLHSTTKHSGKSSRSPHSPSRSPHRPNRSPHKDSAVTSVHSKTLVLSDLDVSPSMDRSSNTSSVRTKKKGSVNPLYEVMGKHTGLVGGVNGLPQRYLIKSEDLDSLSGLGMDQDEDTLGEDGGGVLDDISYSTMDLSELDGEESKLKKCHITSAYNV